MRNFEEKHFNEFTTPIKHSNKRYDYDRDQNSVDVMEALEDYNTFIGTDGENVNDPG